VAVRVALVAGVDGLDDDDLREEKYIVSLSELSPLP